MQQGLIKSFDDNAAISTLKAGAWWKELHLTTPAHQSYIATFNITLQHYRYGIQFWRHDLAQ